MKLINVKRAASLLGLTVVTVAAALGGASLAHDSDEAVPPAEGGIVSLSPSDAIPVAGPDGEPIVCDDGKVLRTNPATDNPSPELIETEPAPGPGDVGEVTQGAVPRCGPSGGGQDADPVWVPEDVGQEYPQEAPRRFVRLQAK